MSTIMFVNIFMLLPLKLWIYWNSINILNLNNLLHQNSRKENNNVVDGIIIGTYGTFDQPWSYSQASMWNLWTIKEYENKYHIFVWSIELDRSYRLLLVYKGNWFLCSIILWQSVKWGILKGKCEGHWTLDVIGNTEIKHWSWTTRSDLLKK